MLVVSYQCGLTKSFEEHVCLEHEGPARARAEKWWKTRWKGNAGDIGAPADCRTAWALSDQLRVPGRIRVVRDGKRWNVDAYDFAVDLRQLAIKEGDGTPGSEIPF